MQNLARARELTDQLFGLVEPAALYERPIPERHRMLFYLGHLEAFDWNLIGRSAMDRPSFHPTFDRLFAFGIDPPPGRLPADTPRDWPSLQELEAYNRRVREEVDSLLPAVPEQLLWVAIEHRLMHAETFTYILHQLDYGKKFPTATGSRDGEGAVQPQPAALVRLPAGPARLGRHPGEGFGWDNEFPAVTVDVPDFAISSYKVTNGDYLEYVRQTGSPAPFFWRDRGGAWFYHGMWEEIPLPLDCPVYATHDEAGAYARWRGMRLPSEAEWHRAACVSQPSRNLDFHAWDPVSVFEGEGGIQQAIGNGWEWTSTAFAPFPGFQPFPFYPNYSEPFFDGGHYVLKGASPRTARCFLRSSFRNWFRPAYPYVYATFRMVEN